MEKVVFIFLLTVYGEDIETTVVDHNLSGEECIALMVGFADANPHSVFVPSCEIDYGPEWAVEVFE